MPDDTEGEAVEAEEPEIQSRRKGKPELRFRIRIFGFSKRIRAPDFQMSHPNPFGKVQIVEIVIAEKMVVGNCEIR